MNIVVRGSVWMPRPSMLRRATVESMIPRPAAENSAEIVATV